MCDARVRTCDFLSAKAVGRLQFFAGDLASLFRIEMIFDGFLSLGFQRIVEMGRRLLPG